MRRSLVLALVAALATLTGACGSGHAEQQSDRQSARPSDPSEQQSARPSENPAERAARARQVAAAWNGSRAEASWRAGYHPLGDWTALPKGLTDLPLTLRATLPPLPRPDAEVKWPDGSTLKAPLIPASTAYEALDRYEGPLTQLPVTSVTLGTMPLRTSRGPATVPAWLFMVEGHTEPIRRAAASPSPLPKSPIAPTSSTVNGNRVENIQGSTLTIVTPHGSCDDGVEVEALETPGSVVLTPYTVNPQEGLCRADLKMERVKVNLAGPLADRILLDASTGAPIPYDAANGPSPTWS
ncbi:hypothetical protein ACSCBZ_32440 [Streptomyces niveiscabiei]|uniref:hypothetical protein n=1 Tax=Streptomyces niveiscabiei TaxID=164115 RepID=UPI0006EB8C96|nr:hypothetical protein [Streptomyces niveiscabiei]